MKIKYIFIAIVFFLFFEKIETGFSQNISINAAGNAPNSSSILDLDGATGFSGPKGYKRLLIPRMTNAQIIGIATLSQAAQGLIVYQADGIQGFYYNTSTTTTPSWSFLLPSSSGRLT